MSWSERGLTCGPHRSKLGAAHPRVGAVQVAPHPVGTRSPQPVHIPGDNFSTCRCRSLSAESWLLGDMRSPTSTVVTAALWTSRPQRLDGVGNGTHLGGPVAGPGGLPA